MSDTLLLIGIGPVQDFIASARKLRDLWFGSHLLSELSKTVARCLHEKGATLIFPSVENPAELAQNSDLNVANKIMARVSSPEEADRLQKLARTAWRDHFLKLAEDTLEKMEKMGRFKVMEEIFRGQLDDYGELYAAWVQIDRAIGYAGARRRLEQLLSARKNVREFSPPRWEGFGLKKNSLDGMRESVVPPDAREILGLLKKNEKLDAMGCIKRFYPLTERMENRHFDDLSDMALRPWIEGIARRDDTRELFKAFQGAVLTDTTRRRSKRGSGDIVPQFVLSDLFYAQKKELQEALEDTKDPQAAWKARSNLVRKCGEPPLYAAILVGDGDRMGQMIDAIDSEWGHAAFTREMSRFAMEVRPTIEKAGGSLVYSGGDDVMAYLPLHTAVECADSLRLKFASLMKRMHQELRLQCEVPTFSVGIAFVHHSLPLDQALNLARQAERKAKTEGGRNALCIIQSKRSGGETAIVGKWDDEGDLKGIAYRIRDIADLYNKPDSILPARLGYQLREARLSAGDALSFGFSKERIVPENAAAALVKRILDQKNDGDAEKNRQLTPLLAGRGSVRSLSDELVVVHQIAQAMGMAQGKEAS